MICVFNQIIWNITTLQTIQSFIQLNPNNLRHHANTLQTNKNVYLQKHIIH